MKLATLANGTRDGRLVIVSHDHAQAVAVEDIAATLQDAIERWPAVQPALKARADLLAAGKADGAFDFATADVLAPLPRAWQWLDGSVYGTHGDLMQKMMGLPPVTRERPLMYQGISDQILPPTADVAFPTEDDGIDFEGEFGVIIDEVPMGATPAEAAEHIRLVVQINDWSLRVLGKTEMQTGFGWIQAKPPIAMAPVAVTPDELGNGWRDGRVDLPLLIDWNGKRVGAAEGYAMDFNFPELIAHAARTRTLCAGTIIGSGTVSNENYAEVGSSCVAEVRAIEIIAAGKPATDFMRFGDTIRMEARTWDGLPAFGAIAQTVVRA
ncbi:fumarylacetoacetate hydrolase family protein [Sphingomonas sp.]|jgi:fumarylacetoacetate (FAA) hydrolase|uniref:fumarylacetoacetate hydrolase family protein n=1 Tax=Sphingomonas sp. TaxID=28214 RepID=UPI002D7EB213|nr:fumarylacetoacetate hydrolase family protein [Sphingomonas sp.]HEU0043514.1 fumarylacetoacetate hydrolase family protein [Sphingomonas sp.]